MNFAPHTRAWLLLVAFLLGASIALGYPTSDHIGLVLRYSAAWSAMYAEFAP